MAVKPGDKVRINAPNTIYHGKVGRVARIMSNNLTYPVEVQFADSRHNFKHSEVTKVG